MTMVLLYPSGIQLFSGHTRRAQDKRSSQCEAHEDRQPLSVAGHDAERFRTHLELDPHTQTWEGIMGVSGRKGNGSRYWRAGG